MSRPKAFTLAELLVALAITSVLVILLVSVVSAAMNVWQQGRNQIDTFSNARQTLGRIADEVKGAIASGQIEFSENLPGLQGSSTAQPGISENIFVVAPYPNSGAGDLCVIAYRHNSDTHELQRAFLNSQNAWNIGSPRYQAAGYDFQRANNQWPDGTAQWRTIAQGVLEFEIRSYSQYELDNDATPVPSWNSVNGDPSNTSDTTIIGNVPRRVVIRLKLIDDKALVRLNALPATGAAHDRIVAQSAREFTADITLLPPH
jgi:type II secretory pathway component PulJ